MPLSDTGAASVVTLAVNAAVVAADAAVVPAVAVVAADAAEDTAADETLHELETLRNLPAFCSTSRWYLHEWVDLMTEDGYLCQMLEDLVYLFMSRDPLNRSWMQQNQLNWVPQTRNYAVMLLQHLSKCPEPSVEKHLSWSPGIQITFYVNTPTGAVVTKRVPINTNLSLAGQVGLYPKERIGVVPGMGRGM